MGNKQASRKAEKANEKPPEIHINNPRLSVSVKKNISEQRKRTSISSLIPRKEVDFLRQHAFSRDQSSAVRNTLANIYHIPSAISDTIIRFFDGGPYFRSYCKISLSFSANLQGDNDFEDFIHPAWFDPNQLSKWFTMIPYGMGSCSVLDSLSWFVVGSRWRQNWGQQTEYDGHWRPHQYREDKIYVGKATALPEEQRCDPKDNKKSAQAIAFHIIPHTFVSSEFVFEWQNSEMYVFGDVAVLCVDYALETSLGIADVYAADVVERQRFKMISVVVVDCADEEEEDQEVDCVGRGNVYFGWDDVVKLADKYDASCFEISRSQDDDNVVFVYNQLIFEYVYWCSQRHGR